MAAPILYAIARDGADWQGRRTRLEPRADGALALAALPAPLEGVPVRRQGPAPAQVEGLAVAPDGAIAEADPARGIIEVSWPGCPEPLILGHGGRGPVVIPGPLAWTDGLLAAVDRADRTIARLDPFGGGLVARYYAPFTAPIGLAADSEGRLLVLDVAAPHLHRLDRWGRADTDFAARLAAAPADAAIVQPLAVSAGQGDWVLVADARRGVLVFDAEGAALGPVPGLSAALLPGALAAARDRLYLADRGDGVIRALAATAGEWLGPLPHWSGPVAALAVGPDDALWIKPEPALSRLRFEPEGAFAATGLLELGPLDAGEEQDWHRLASSAEAPAGTSLSVSIARKDVAQPSPADTDYVVLTAPDVLLRPAPSASDADAGLPPPLAPPEPLARFLWIRIALASDAGNRSPVLEQVTAATRGERFIDHLPGFYAEATPPGGLLDRLCDVLGLGITAAADAAQAWPGLLVPDSAPHAMLDALLAWLDRPVPAWVPSETRRDLLRTAVRRHLQRGTMAGLVADIAAESGLTVFIREDYHERRIWQLDAGAGLGFDTALASADAEGLLTGGRLDTGEPCPPTFPSALAGAAHAGPAAGFGADLFAEHAHRFTLVAPADTDEGALAAAIAVAARDRPAHAAFGACRAPARAELGALVLGRGAHLRGEALPPLEHWQLGSASRLAGPQHAGAPLLTLGDSDLGGSDGG